jgi:hypothetical protein
MSEEFGAKLSVRSFHTVFYCRKWKEYIAFYRDVLGFFVVFANEMLVELKPAAGARSGLMSAARTRWPASHGDSFILFF